MTTGCLNGKRHGGSSSAAVWRDGSSIIRESFSSTPSPWKQQEDFWTRLIDSFIGWFHWDTIHLDLQLVSKEEVARRGSSVISSVIANQRQLTPGHSQCRRERVFGSMAPTDFWSCWTSTTLFFMKKNHVPGKWCGVWWQRTHWRTWRDIAVLQQPTLQGWTEAWSLKVCSKAGQQWPSVTQQRNLGIPQVPDLETRRMASGLSPCYVVFRTPWETQGWGTGLFQTCSCLSTQKQMANYGSPSATDSFCRELHQTPPQDLESPTELQKTEPKLPLKQIWDQKVANRQVQHRGGQLFPSSCQTRLTENPTRKSQQAMASDENGRIQAASWYLFHLPSWIFSLAVTTSECLALPEKSWQHHKKPTGRCPFPSSELDASFWFTPHMTLSTNGQSFPVDMQWNHRTGSRSAPSSSRLWLQPNHLT